MPSISKAEGPLAFGGSLSLFALAAANWTLLKAVESRSRSPFFAVHPTVEAPCLILPQLTPSLASFTLLYGLRRESMKPAAIASGRIADDLAKAWRSICRGFVEFELTHVGKPIGINHNATVRAASELLETRWEIAPTLSAFDAAYGTSLEMLAEEQANAMETAIYAPGDLHR